jgi:hypothetical protein
MVYGPGRRGRCWWQQNLVGDFVELGDKVFPWQGVLPLVLIPALHGRPFPVGLRPLSPCLHNVSALPVICFPEPLFALSHVHYIAQHCTHRLLATLCSPSGLQVRI